MPFGGLFDRIGGFLEALTGLVKASAGVWWASWVPLGGLGRRKTQKPSYPARCCGRLFFQWPFKSKPKLEYRCVWRVLLAKSIKRPSFFFDFPLPKTAEPPQWRGPAGGMRDGCLNLNLQNLKKS